MVSPTIESRNVRLPGAAHAIVKRLSEEHRIPMVELLDEAIEALACEQMADICRHHAMRPSRALFALIEGWKALTHEQRRKAISASADLEPAAA